MMCCFYFLSIPQFLETNEKSVWLRVSDWGSVAQTQFLCHYCGAIPTITGIKYTPKHLILLSKSEMITLGKLQCLSCADCKKKYGYLTYNNSLIKSDYIRMDLILNADFYLIQTTS